MIESGHFDIVQVDVSTWRLIIFDVDDNGHRQVRDIHESESPEQLLNIFAVAALPQEFITAVNEQRRARRHALIPTS